MSTRVKQRKRAQQTPAKARPPRGPPPAPPARGPSIRIVVLGALALLVLGLLVAVLHSAPRAAGHNNIDADGPIDSVEARSTFCQTSETVPQDTRELRVSLATNGPPGPAVRASATRGGSVVTSGRVSGGWSGNSVTIPVRAVEQTVRDVRVCFTTGAGAPTELLGSNHETIGDDFTRGPEPADDRPIEDRFRIDYLRGGSESLLSRLPAVVERMGLNAPVRGPWAALFVFAMMLATVVLVSVRLLRDLTPKPPGAAVPGEAATAPTAEDAPPPRRRPLRSLTRRVPVTGWICALVAVLNAGAWAILSPPFQLLDEQDHYSYVQRLAETGKPPTDRSFRFSREVSLALHDLRYLTVRTRGDNVPLWLDFERDRLDRVLDRPLSRTDRPGAGTATGQPPLAYALQAVPYKVASSASLLQRLTLMRLLSVLLAGVTALLVFLFVREVLPRSPWAWTVGGLGAALQPLFGYASASVNPDALLFAVSAALFYCVARAFRRGLTPRLSVVTGLVLSAGLLTKFSFVGLVPGVLLALVLIAIRQATSSGSTSPLRVLRLPAIALASALAPFLVIAVINVTAWSQPTLGVVTVGNDIATSSSSQGGGPSQAFGVIWQLYLPPLGGMRDDIPTSALPLKNVWLDGFVGSFGWMTIKPPSWVTGIGVIPALVALLLCGLAFARSMGDVRPRTRELVAYAVMIGGMCLTIGLVQYASVAVGSRAWFGQSRYLLPLLAPFAVVLALAARGAGRGWGRTVGVLIVMVVLAHAIFSQLLTISQYYA